MCASCSLARRVRRLYVLLQLACMRAGHTAAALPALQLLLGRSCSPCMPAAGRQQHARCCWWCPSQRAALGGCRAVRLLPAGSGKTSTLEGVSVQNKPGSSEGEGLMHLAIDELFALMHGKAVAVGECPAAGCAYCQSALQGGGGAKTVTVNDTMSGQAAQLWQP